MKGRVFKKEWKWKTGRNVWGSEGGVLSIRGKSGRGGVEKGERA